MLAYPNNGSQGALEQGALEQHALRQTAGRPQEELILGWHNPPLLAASVTPRIVRLLAALLRGRTRPIARPTMAHFALTAHFIHHALAFTQCPSPPLSSQSLSATPQGAPNAGLKAS